MLERLKNCFKPNNYIVSFKSYLIKFSLQKILRSLGGGADY